MPERQLSDLIGRIYDAALDPALWAEVLEEASEFVGGAAASAYAKGSVAQTIDIARDYGIEDPFRRSDINEYVELDLPPPGFFDFGLKEVVNTSDILPYDEFLDSRFYSEWARPQGWIDAVTSVLENAATAHADFAVFRREREDPVDEETRRRMQLLLPHVRQSVLIGKTIKSKGAAAAALADTLDSVTAAVFLVDTTGRLVRTNQGGRALLADASILRMSGGYLIANDPGANRLLGEALTATVEAGPSMGRRGISLPLPAPNSRHCVAHVLPLTAGARRAAGMWRAATAAIFVRQVQLETPVTPEVIARLYGLTPSELRVLLAAFEGGSVADIAKALGISPGTAKTHLRRLFSKTGTKRQADLVKLVAGFAACAT